MVSNYSRGFQNDFKCCYIQLPGNENNKQLDALNIEIENLNSLHVHNNVLQISNISAQYTNKTSPSHICVPNNILKKINCI